MRSAALVAAFVAAFVASVGVARAEVAPTATQADQRGPFLSAGVSAGSMNIAEAAGRATDADTKLCRVT